jgi:4-hydroxy-2-oxoglutarate aldolase
VSLLVYWLTISGAGSTRETIALCKSAADAGADIVIVIPPGYFAGAMSKPAIKTFFLDVAAASPLPVMMYNYPGAAGSIDMDSDLIIDVARSSPNICGVKLTCGAVGKLTRIAAATAIPEFKKQYPRSSASAPDFLTLGGFADFLLPTVMGSRAGGAIMGLGNVFPKSLAKLMEYASQKDLSGEEFKKAIALQDLASSTDATFAKTGIAGTKWFLQKHEGYTNGRVRRPLLECDPAVGKALEENEDVKKFREIEKNL